MSGRWRIAKSFTFAASHQLPSPPLPADHQCARLHGHNYEVVVTLEATDLDDRGFIQDYGDVDAVVRPYIDTHLEHRHLNDFLRNPTAELLASRLFADLWVRFPSMLLSVEVKETPRTSAVYYRR